ncbi:MAG TPA: NAD+ synthase [Acidimicrobiales bacterium]
MHVLRVALCQLDVVVGDLEGNADRIITALDQAEHAGADVAVFGELAVTGYPPEDLLLKPGFVRANREALDRIAARSGRCVAVVGFVDAGLDLHNAAAVLAHGGVQGIYHKRVLPNYGVFDEQRYFTPGTGSYELFLIGGVRVGIAICEDVWSPTGPMSAQAAGGAELILDLNASPYSAGRVDERVRMLATRAADASCGLVYVNQVGGQDELVFDGRSMIFGPDGSLLAAAPQFDDTVLLCDVEVAAGFRKRLLDPRGRTPAEPLPVTALTEANPLEDRPLVPTATVAPALGATEEIYRALVVGLRDYVTKSGFTDVVFGLSGGIDSALVSVIAVDALGADRVHPYALPSRYSTDGSVLDAEKLAANLGVELRSIAIESAFSATLELLAPEFAGREPGIAEENLQGRIRANLMMALANKFPSWLVLICGNKSELAVGYTTVYGIDMAGGFAVIKDVTKSSVYALAAARNELAGYDLIPASILAKPPSAELRPDQRDTDSLPPYEVLDPIVLAYVEQDATAEDLVEAGHDAETVQRITRMIDAAEWKRRQAPVGVRVTPKAFGKDRRVPIVNRYRG